MLGQSGESGAYASSESYASPSPPISGGTISDKAAEEPVVDTSQFSRVIPDLHITLRHDSEGEIPSIQHEGDHFFLYGVDITEFVAEGTLLKDLSYFVGVSEGVISIILIDFKPLPQAMRQATARESKDITDLFTETQISELFSIWYPEGELGMPSPSLSASVFTSTPRANSVNSGAGLDDSSSLPISADLNSDQRVAKRNLLSLAKYLYAVTTNEPQSLKLPIDLVLANDFYTTLINLSEGRLSDTAVVAHCFSNRDYIILFRRAFSKLAKLSPQQMKEVYAAFIINITSENRPETIYIQYAILNKMHSNIMLLRQAFDKAPVIPRKNLTDEHPSTSLEWAYYGVVEALHQMVRYLYRLELDNSIDFYHFNDFANLLVNLYSGLELPLRYPQITDGWWSRDEYIIIRNIIQDKIGRLAVLSSANAFNDVIAQVQRAIAIDSVSPQEVIAFVESLKAMDAYLKEVPAEASMLFQLGSLKACKDDYMQLLHDLSSGKRVANHSEERHFGEFVRYRVLRENIIASANNFSIFMAAKAINTALIRFFSELNRDRTPESKFIYENLCHIDKRKKKELISALHALFDYFKTVDFVEPVDLANPKNETEYNLFDFINTLVVLLKHGRIPRKDKRIIEGWIWNTYLDKRGEFEGLAKCVWEQIAEDAPDYITLNVRLDPSNEAERNAQIEAITKEVYGALLQAVVNEFIDDICADRAPEHSVIIDRVKRGLKAQGHDVEGGWRVVGLSPASDASRPPSVASVATAFAPAPTESTAVSLDAAPTGPT